MEPSDSTTGEESVVGLYGGGEEGCDDGLKDGRGEGEEARGVRGCDGWGFHAGRRARGDMRGEVERATSAGGRGRGGAVVVGGRGRAGSKVQ